MKILLFLIGALFLTVLPAFSAPIPHLELLGSAPWDSSFTYHASKIEGNEIDSICRWLYKTFIRQRTSQFDTIYSGNDSFKLETKYYSVYRKDDLWVDATFFAEGKKIWFDTLRDAWPRYITDDGQYLLATDNMANGDIIFYQTQPDLKHITVAEDGYHYGWQLLAKKNFVFGLGSDFMSLYQTDGTLIWERDSLSSLEALRLARFCVSKDEESVLTGHYDEANKEISLSLWDIDGNQINEIVFPSPRSYLRLIYVSSSEPRLAVAVFDAALACFDMSAKQERWTCKYPDLNVWSGSVDFSPDGKTIAAVISHWNPKEEKPHIQLFDSKAGILHGNYVNLDDSMKLWRENSKIEFTKDGKYLIAVTPKRKYLFRLNYEK